MNSALWHHLLTSGPVDGALSPMQEFLTGIVASCVICLLQNNRIFKNFKK